MRAATRTLLGLSGVAVAGLASERFLARRVHNRHHPEWVSGIGLVATAAARPSRPPTCATSPCPPPTGARSTCSNRARAARCCSCTRCGSCSSSRGSPRSASVPDRFDWAALAPGYDEVLEGVAAGRPVRGVPLAEPC